MLVRLKVHKESLDSTHRTLQARGEVPEASSEEREQIARDLEGGAVGRLYRGGDPRGRVVAARATDDGLWLKLRFLPRDTDVWRLVEGGAINTIEVQTLDPGVDVFLKSVAATYPEEVSWTGN